MDPNLAVQRKGQRSECKNSREKKVSYCRSAYSHMEKAQFTRAAAKIVICFFPGEAG